MESRRAAGRAGDDRRGVEAQAPRTSPGRREPSEGRAANAGSLCRAEGRRGVHERSGSPRPDLDEDEEAVTLGDDVELEPADADVRSDDPVAV